MLSFMRMASEGVSKDMYLCRGNDAVTGRRPWSTVWGTGPTPRASVGAAGHTHEAKHG